MPIQPLKICFCAFLQPDFMKRWGEQNGQADKTQESLCQLVIAGGDAAIALDSFEEVFYQMTAAVDCWGEGHGRGAVAASRNAGFYSFSARCLPECRAIIGFVADEGRAFWQALGPLFDQ